MVTETISKVKNRASRGLYGDVAVNWTIKVKMEFVTNQNTRYV